MADDPRDMAHAVVTTMRLAMAADDVVERGERPAAGAGDLGPRRASSVSSPIEPVSRSGRA